MKLLIIHERMHPHPATRMPESSDKVIRISLIAGLAADKNSILQAGDSEEIVRLTVTGVCRHTNGEARRQNTVCCG
ncbi:hypothetical protein BL250_02830 [Erwinia sp. OLTSP20]|uniref:hypothetical protein n=1 Tax=unclassified Erwinia TaxID=2622719 RepID=UPI000C185FB9|nr:MULTISPECIES: hypothetical protein [unclassified Erwinia]PIJ51911.1 hypothetical protein BV501_01725 [Erwinia sp. OAMSP11]PIJ74786.1 hypothetical protein BK416_03065 [Erwinia sp. OLSSP12]PIJ85172.1 hypothetical protein BLD47_00805 [Erwinia sp. OLCASP19]PIJ87173.1 hypothetical protein BLD46_01200 [Erwinia sp. OLMTSP26]PIJ88317.1 hypothetical protein BLD49_02255 [Erwinia sp. OLMDSP33]